MDKTQVQGKAQTHQSVVEALEKIQNQDEENCYYYVNYCYEKYFHYNKGTNHQNSNNQILCRTMDKPYIIDSNKLHIA